MEIVKKSIRKGYRNHQSFPKKLVIDKDNITHEGLIAKYCNTYFAKIGANLAKTIETSSISFFFYKCDIIQPESPFSVKELKDAFFYHLKSTKVLRMMTLVLMSSGITLVLC